MLKSPKRKKSSIIKFKLYFILLDQRSGSTLLASLLSKWMNTFVAPETNFPIQILINFPRGHVLTNEDCTKISQILADDRKINDWGITDELKVIVQAALGKTPEVLVDEIYTEYVNSLKLDDTLIIGFKKESYMMVVDRLKELYPTSKFICMLRDPRGIFQSKKTSVNTAIGKMFDKNVTRSALTWNQYVRSVNCVISTFPGDVLIVKYEDLINSEELTMQSVVDFLGLKIEKHEGNYTLHERYAVSHGNIGKPPIKGNDRKWKRKLSATEICLIEWVCKHDMREQGYTLVSQAYTRSMPRIIWGMLYTVYFKFAAYIKRRYGRFKYHPNGCFVVSKRH
ncbi:MAG: sulfotransferase [Alphaproteobacteria bacterium]|nr:sulfotransferase [Alphaproteobacteria bacterium]